MNREEEIICILEKYKQQHVIDLLKKLDDYKKKELFDQIERIDFEQLKSLYENTKKEIEIKENKIEAITYYDKNKLEKEQKEKWDKIGKEIK